MCVLRTGGWSRTVTVVKADSVVATLVSAVCSLLSVASCPQQCQFSLSTEHSIIIIIMFVNNVVIAAVTSVSDCREIKLHHYCSLSTV